MSGRTPERQTYSDTFDMAVKLKVLTCFYEKCVLPVGANAANMMADRRPADFVYWREAESWDVDVGVPLEGDDVMVPAGQCVLHIFCISVCWAKLSLGKLWQHGCIHTAMVLLLLSLFI